MTDKKEARRLNILSQAAELFLERGYERTSMDEINTRLGCSKTTLYKYFPSKEELFADAIQSTISEQACNAFATIALLQDESQDLWQGLETFGISYLKLQLSPMMLNVNRVVIAEGERTGIGEMMYRRGPLRAWQEVGKYFQVAMDKGLMRQADTQLVAMQLKGLLESGMVDRRLRGAVLTVSDDEIQQQVFQAIDTFRRAYQA